MMTSYWITNIGLGVMVLLALPLLRTAPPRLKMWMCMAAAVAWCVPWPALASLWQSNDVFVQYVSWDVLRTLPDATNSIIPSASMNDVPWLWILAGLIGSGSCLFATRLIAYARKSREWQRTAQEVSDGWRRAGFPEITVPVYVVPNLENAFVSGYWRPRICLGEKQFASPSLHSILLHELTHVRQHDNLILLLVTFIEDAFWWNPLVQMLTSKSRRYVELSCDRSCKQLSPKYGEHLADELLRREYRMLDSKLINPISRSPGFNAYRILQLATEASLKIRHVLLLALLVLSSIVLASNISASEGVESERQIVTHLIAKTVTTESDGSINTRSIETEFIGEPEVEKLLNLARRSDVTLRTKMVNDYRREITIESNSLVETRKVLEAFSSSEMQHILDSRVLHNMGRHIFLDLSFQARGERRHNVKLAPNVGSWTGVAFGDYLLRIKPDLLGTPGEQTVLLSTEISAKGERENHWDLIGTPRVRAEFDLEAKIQIGHHIGDGDPTISMTMVPRKNLN